MDVEGGSVDDDAGTCALCGARLGEHDWFALEVARPTTDQHGATGRFSDYVDAAFCSQEHAARWLDQPLPPPEPVRVVRASRWERVAMVAAAVALVIGVGLATVGVVAVVHWLTQP